LKAIGRGTFCIKNIAVMAYVFKDEDLIHNLLGIAPFADCGCEAVFTATDFKLSHNNDLLLTGKRHSANLWHIALPSGHSPSDPMLPIPYHAKRLQKLSCSTKTLARTQSTSSSSTPASGALHLRPFSAPLKEDTSRAKTNSRD
jgi:hypothetical protein